MSDRERILAEIKLATSVKNKISINEVEGITYVDKKKQFIEVLTMIGGKVIEVDSETEIKSYTSQQIAMGKKLVNVFANGKVEMEKDELYAVDIAIMRGGIAVAENGCIWVTEKNMGNRMLPFACQQLVLVIEAKNIVNNMHEAYSKINIVEDGYAAFIAGPSKTADIEQSLVIGAHGPIDFLVFILD